MLKEKLKECESLKEEKVLKYLLEAYNNKGYIKYIVKFSSIILLALSIYSIYLIATTKKPEFSNLFLYSLLGFLLTILVIGLGEGDEIIKTKIKKTRKDFILETLKKHKNGLTKKELFEKAKKELGLKESNDTGFYRLIRELKRNGIIEEDKESKLKLVSNIGKR